MVNAQYAAYPATIDLFAVLHRGEQENSGKKCLALALAPYNYACVITVDETLSEAALRHFGRA